MGIPYLNSDESILLSTHNILVDAVVSEMILTNQRLLLVDSDSTPSRHTEIPFAAIETVTTMESGSGDPAISLAILKKTGGTIPLQLVFTQLPRSQRTDERDTWTQGIKEQIALMPAGTAPEYVDFEEDEAEDLKKLIGYKAEGTPAVAEDKNPPAGTRSKNKSPLSSRFHPPSPAGISKNMLIAGAAIVVIILLIAGAAFIYPAFMLPKTSVPLPVVTPVPTTIATIVPVTTAALTAEPTPVTAITPEQTVSSQPTAITTTLPPQSDITATGVWVKIVYEGQYTGAVGTGGRMIDVKGTGGRFYRISAASTDVVEVAVQKLDTSGLPMTIEVYNNGRIIQQKTIITPKGTLAMTVDLKTG
ncbi:MAG: PH domain-containing protein [Methanoregula sp.]|nr:PH domain-containing protein [Methanoregula sp.]